MFFVVEFASVAVRLQVVAVRHLRDLETIAVWFSFNRCFLLYLWLILVNNGVAFVSFLQINGLLVVVVLVVVDNDFVAAQKMVDWLLLVKWLLQKTSAASGRKRARERACRRKIQQARARVDENLNTQE